MVIHELEQNSDEWFDARKGIPTASQFKNIITSKGKPSTSIDKYAAKLAAELYCNKPINDFSGNQWTERGHELEEQAKYDYSFSNDVELVTPGFVTNDDFTCGCSPDSFVGEDGLLEVKCLKTENHVIMVSKNNKTCLTDYYAQVQGQIHVTNRQWCDLLFYHPDLPNLVIRCDRDNEFIESLEKQIESVIVKRDKFLDKLINVNTN